jgi:cytoskeletal protein RodZ
MAAHKPELFKDVLEDDLGGRPVSAKQKVGGASLRPDEFKQGRAKEEIVDRFNILQAEEEAYRSQVQRRSKNEKRLRWTGTLWVLSGLAALGVAAACYALVLRYQQGAQQRELASAAAARRNAEEERILRMGAAPTPTAAPESPPPRAPSPPGKR